MYMTLGEAAKATGKSKGTISKYLKNGKLSFHSKSEYGYKIDPSELFRVFPKNAKETVTNERLETPNKHLEHMRLEIELEAARKEIKQLEESREELRSERNEWREQAKRLALPTPEMGQSPLNTTSENKNKFWKWLAS